MAKLRAVLRLVAGASMTPDVVCASILKVKRLLCAVIQYISSDILSLAKQAQYHSSVEHNDAMSFAAQLLMHGIDFSILHSKFRAVTAESTD